jgi:uncharacterized caspase-like protein
MRKISYSRRGLIISLLLSVVFPVVAEGVTTYLSEGFEGAFSDGAPSGWTEEYTTWLFDWIQYAGDYDSMNPASPHSGSYNALLFFGNQFEDHKTWLITPVINFGETTSATLEFYHQQRQGMAGGQDELRVYYRRSETGSWILLKSYTSEVETWTKRTILLPNLSSSYYIGFLGNAKYGFGVCIDDVRIYSGGDDGGSTGSDNITNCYAVICGVSDYPGTTSDLNYCDDDAIDLRDALLALGNWKSENITMLTDSAATKSAIQTAISVMADSAGPNDLCLFSFSGHGTTGTDTAPIDEIDGVDEFISAYDDNIRDDELSVWIDALPTDKYVVLLDTCFSGGQIKGMADSRSVSGRKLIPKGVGSIVPQKGDGFADDFATKGARVISSSAIQTKDLDDLGRGVVLTACDEDEESYETEDLQNGVFTYYVVEALAGPADTDGDGAISAEECYVYARPRAAAYTELAEDGSQNAQIYDEYPGELELSFTNPIITKCTVKAGKRPIVTAKGDSITVQGELNARFSDFEDAMDATMSVAIDSNDMNDPCVITFPVDADTFKGGKYRYSKKVDGVKKTFKYDTGTHKFSFSAGKINLSGLSCPVIVTVEIGGYSATIETYESIVNGKRLIPVNLLMGVADSLRVDKIKVKQNTKKPTSDQLTVKGGFSAWDDGVNMVGTDVNVILGTQTWTIPQGNFKAKTTKFTCSRIATDNEIGIAAAKFDFSKGVFTLAIKNADIDDIHGVTNFEINFADVNSTTDVNVL